MDVRISPSVETIVEALLADSGLEGSDRLWMFVQLCDDKLLMNELTKQATLQKVGIVSETAVHSFAYGILRLAKPHLFIGGEKNDQEGN